MFAVTRTPRVLVKLQKATRADRVAFRPGNRPLTVRVEPLFKSIPPQRRMGLTGPGGWHVLAADAGAEVNAWDLCHHLVAEGFGVTGLPQAGFAEPDLEQQWVAGTPIQHALAATASCDRPQPPDPTLPAGAGPFWFRDTAHSQLEAARASAGGSGPVRIAHLDTGYDPNHQSRPRHLLTALQKNFVEPDLPGDATDHTSGILTNLGHGTGTLSILAGGAVDGVDLGGAPEAEVIPVRVANSVVLFRNSSIAQALDYVHGLFADPSTRAHVITMSMGGLASQAWAEAVNALYDLGVFIVTAAGNNFGNLPTRMIVYPARFGRVVAACGVMADGTPYADLPLATMAGNYGPAAKMRTAMAAYTPNTPWARLGCPGTVDLDGRGTSAATPQIAAAAALWVERNMAACEAYAQGWMRVEAVRAALFESARAAADARLGRGTLHAGDALARPPAAPEALHKEDPDAAEFALFRVLTGLGAAPPDARQRMIELEALQISQRSRAIEEILVAVEENGGDVSAEQRRQLIELFHDAPGASQTLRAELAGHASPAPPPPRPASDVLPPADAARLQLAMEPPMPVPTNRTLRVFAFDPVLGYSTETIDLNESAIQLKYEPLQPGPVGEYLEVVDVDPATACCYAPVDLDHPTALAQNGLSPSESNPRFHQQMVYAVAMKTIAHFELALGRVALWSPRFVKYNGGREKHYVQRLRIYPHALREQNAFYSPEKKALLLGYFPASTTNAGEMLPGGSVFCALSHDIIAHETTHALLDGLHRYYGEPTNPDMLSFHEAFADIVAIFQHFTMPDALRSQIRKTRGNLARQNMLADLALQFGQAIGNSKALRSALGTPATGTEYSDATEAHDRGAVLVAAVFDAFLDIYRRRSADLIRLATSGTGVLPRGEIPYDLVNRLAQEASKTAGHVLNICIRALDYCPPLDLRFGEYVRALITADRDLVPDDKWGYRPAFVQGFRRRGIYPENVRNLSSESLCWERPEVHFDLEKVFASLELRWDLHIDRREAFLASDRNARVIQEFFRSVAPEQTKGLGFYRDPADHLDGVPGELREFDVHSVRPVRRVGPDGQQKTDLVIEITQSWIPADGSGKFRGGCTLIIDMEQRAVKYVVRKRVDHMGRMEEQHRFQAQLALSDPAFTYSGAKVVRKEPFALMHRAKLTLEPDARREAARK